jgi:hypothetical protein
MMAVFTRNPAEMVHDEITKRFPLGRRWRNLAPSLTGGLFVRFVEGHVAVVRQRVLQGNLMT